MRKQSPFRLYSTAKRESTHIRRERRHNNTVRKVGERQVIAKAEWRRRRERPGFGERRKVDEYSRPSTFETAAHSANMRRDLAQAGKGYPVGGWGRRRAR